MRSLRHACFGLMTAAVLVGALALAPASAEAVVAPAADHFYVPPTDLSRYAPGTILRDRKVTMSGPQQAETADAYQLLFRTTDASGRPTVAVTTVLVPSFPTAGPRRLASYQPYYDSLTLNCAPSYTLQAGGGGTNGPTEESLMSQLLAQGWDVNVPDYEGLQNEWAVGPMLGYATLDSIRAAENFTPDGLGGIRTEVTMNGYSGGSEAATWAASLAPSYAPKLDIIGVAAGGNFPDLDYTMARFDGSLWYGTEIGVMESFSRAFPRFNLARLLNPAGQALAAKDGQDASGCAGSTLNEPLANASQYTTFPTSQALAADPLVKSVLDEISLRYRPKPKAPLFLYNATSDELAFIGPVDALVARYCSAGVSVDFERDPTGLDHIGGIVHYWPAALAYLKSRFDGGKPPSTCGMPNNSTPIGPLPLGAAR